MRNPNGVLTAYFVVMIFMGVTAGTALHGCAPAPKPTMESEQLFQLKKQLNECQSQLTEANKSLDELKARRWILPWRGSELKTANNLPSPSVVVLGAPDIRAAVGHSLMAAADLCGKDKVVGFFRDMVGEIVEKRIPVDIGGAVKKKCQADAEEKINSLITQ